MFFSCFFHVVSLQPPTSLPWVSGRTGQVRGREGRRTAGRGPRVPRWGEKHDPDPERWVLMGFNGDLPSKNGDLPSKNHINIPTMVDLPSKKTDMWSYSTISQWVFPLKMVDLSIVMWLFTKGYHHHYTIIIPSLITIITIIITPLSLFITMERSTMFHGKIHYFYCQ